jgi:plasmid stability protein
MTSMGTLYVREVPEPTLERLRARARANSRSLNSEVLEILDEVTSRDDAELITQRLEELAARIRLPGSRIDDLIRKDREGH